MKTSSLRFAGTSAIALLVATSAHGQIPFTEIAEIDLGSTSSPANLEFIGSNPAAVAWDGTDLFVAGFNNSPAAQNTAIVEIDDVLNAATPGTAFAIQLGTVASRGYSGLDISGGVLAAAYDDGADDPQGITTWTTAGALVCQHTARGSSGVGFDPGFNGAGGAGSGTGYLLLGSGRRSLLDGSCGVLFDSTNGMIITPGGGSLWRDSDFDAATGDVYMRRANDVVRATRSGDNAISAQAVIVDNMENGAFIAQQNLAYIDSTTFGEMVIYNDRMASGPNQMFSFIVKVVDPNGVPVNAVFSENNGDPIVIAPGNGAYDFSWDQGSETLALLDFANRNVHIFMIGAPMTNFGEACNGDGGDQMGCTDCPCGNAAPQGTVGGCVNSGGTSSRLLQSGSASIGAADLRFEASGVAPSNSCVLTSGNALAPANMANPCFGLDSGIQSVSLDGLRCAVQGVLRHGVRPSDANGDVGVTTNGWGAPNGFFQFDAFIAGETKHFQIIHRDDAGQVCMTGQNTSQAVSVTFES